MATSRRSKVVVALLAILGFLAVTLVVLRLVLGMMVRSEEFRELAARLTERALAHVMPRPLINVGKSELTGVWTLQLGDLEVFGARDPSSKFRAEGLAVTPRLSSLFSSELKADAVLTMLDRSEAKVKIAASGDFKGKMVNVNVACEALAFGDLANVLLSELGFLDVRVMQGVADGTIAFVANRGSVALTLKKVIVALPGDDAKSVALADFPLALDIEPESVEFVQPIELRDAQGAVTLAGGLRRPGKDSEWSLRLVASTDGTPSFGNALVRVFRCTTPPTGPRYSVKGTPKAAECLATVE